MDYPRLDRTHFKAQTFREADNHLDYWLSKTPEERLRAAYYLISVAWNFPLDDPPRLNRNVFSTRKQH